MIDVLFRKLIQCHVRFRARVINNIMTQKKFGVVKRMSRAKARKVEKRTVDSVEAEFYETFIDNVKATYGIATGFDCRTSGKAHQLRNIVDFSEGFVIQEGDKLRNRIVDWIEHKLKCKPFSFSKQGTADRW